MPADSDEALCGVMLPPTVWRAAMAVFTWVSLNMTLVLLNKFLFARESFHFPVLIILVGQTVTMVLAGACIWPLRRIRVDWGVVRANWPLLCLIGAAHGLTSGFENMSVSLISVSMNQILKATTPAVTMLLAFLWEGTHFQPALIGANFLIVLGAALTVFHAPECSEHGGGGCVWGVTTALLSVLTSSVQGVLAGRFLHSLNMGVLQLAFVVSPPAIVVLLPIFLLLELTPLRHFNNPALHTDIMLVMVTAFLAFFYTLSTLWVVEATSATYGALVGNVKGVMLVALSMVLFHTVFTPVNLLGIVLGLVGFVAYNWLRLREQNSRGDNDRDAGAERSELELRPMHSEGGQFDTGDAADGGGGFGGGSGETDRHVSSGGDDAAGLHLLSPDERIEKPRGGRRA